jgi:hypothetical protein
VPVTFVIASFSHRSGFGRRIGKQQDVGHVLAPLARKIDLRQVVLAPSKLDQYLFNHQLLGLSFVDGGLGIQRLIDCTQRATKSVEVGVAQGLIRRCLADAAMKKILAEKLTLHEGWVNSLSDDDNGKCSRRDAPRPR